MKGWTSNGVVGIGEVEIKICNILSSHPKFIYTFFDSEKERRKECGKEGKRKRRNEKIKGVREEESGNDGTEINGLISTSMRESHVVYLKEREKRMVN